MRGVQLTLLLALATFCTAQIAERWRNFEEKLIAEQQQILEEDKKAGVHWALVVAGSNGYFNYRHQADACHAYHILSKHGIPDERIVVMMYDDIANNEENPTPGKIINHPNGPNVYPGVPKDYTKEDVTPENFLNILQGKKEAMQGIGSGKVINSGPNDHVFVYFTDHGAPGLIAFPTSELHAKPLNKAIKDMYEAKQFKQMVVYIEACESGSMFENLLPKNISVWATTAANSHESSYACYYDKIYKTYLGDLYSVKWMEDSDQEDLTSETLQKQFKIVKQETNTSHVMQYGNRKIATEPVGDFQGKAKAAPQPPLSPVPFDAVPSEDVPMSILINRLREAETAEEKDKLVEQLTQLKQTQDDIEKKMRLIANYGSQNHEQATRVLNTRNSLTEYDCYESVVTLYDQECYDISTHDYALRQLYVLVNMCQEKIPLRTISDSIRKMCAL